jgi:osmoprotectant transport system substrate-binding protein
MGHGLKLRLIAGLSILIALICAACGSDASGPQSAAPPSSTATAPSSTSTGTSAARTLPGTGKPSVTIGDKNYTEQFVLGDLYRQGLEAEGFTVELTQNIGPTDVTLRALASGSLAMYPEYLNVFNSAVAKYGRAFSTEQAAYQAAQRYAGTHGLALLSPTPFSDTDAIAVTAGYAQNNHLHSLRDLARLVPAPVLGGPPEFPQSRPGLSDLERAYGLTTHGFKPIAVGDQYSALDDGSVQAADVNSTDGQLASGDYRLLADPDNVFGWGNVVPVVSSRALNAEGPAFAATVNRITGLLTMPVIRELNQAVDVAGQDPAAVAKQFLETHGVIAPSPS